MGSPTPLTPQGNMPAIGIPNSQDYARLIFSAPYFEQIAIAEIIQPSVTEAVENILPSLVPQYVDAAVLAGVQQYAVLLTGSTMSGPLFLNPLMPTADAQAATKAYVDAMLATAGIPEVPPVPSGQVWARETGAWVPISQAEGTFLPLSGGTMQGIINMSGNTITNMAAVPAMPNGAAPATWVLNQIASVSLYQGTWDADTNTPDLTQLSVRVNGYTWIAITTSVSGVVIGPAIPGLQGMTIYNGDTIIYSTVQGIFTAIHAGGLTLPEADARYVQLAGSQMSGALLLNANASQNMQAVTFQQLEAAVANTVTPDAPADGQAYLRVGVGTNRWVPGLPLAGGILTGALTLAGPGASGNNAVTVTQLNSAISAAQAGFMPIAGGTFTGPVILSGNATNNLNPVPLQQFNSMLGTYAPLQNPAFTGVPTAPLAAVGTNNGQIASTAFVAAGFLPLTGGTLSGPLLVGGLVTATGPNAGFAFQDQGAGSPTWTWLASGGNAGIGTTASFDLYIDSGGSTHAVGRLNANSPSTIAAGSAGITVEGHTQSAIFGYASASGGAVLVARTDAVAVNFATFLSGAGNTVVGSISNNGSSTGFNQTSDGRLKTASTPIDPDYAGGVIDGLEPIAFDWMAPRGVDIRGGRSYGFVAQDVNEVFPSAVVPGQGEPDDEDFRPWMMDYSKLVPVIVADLQTLRARVAALEAAK